VDNLTRLERSHDIFSSPLLPLVLYPTLFRALHIKGGDKYPTLAGLIAAVTASPAYQVAADASAEALQLSTVQMAEIPEDIDWSSTGLVRMNHPTSIFYIYFFKTIN
jgi:hypothetical protein